MLSVAPRRIERASAPLVGALAAANALPRAPKSPAAIVAHPAIPPAEAIAALEWLIAWEGDHAVAALSYRVTYDFHTMSDAFEITTLAGAAWATVALLREVIATARDRGARVIGAVDVTNRRLARLLMRVARPTRILFEVA